MVMADRPEVKTSSPPVTALTVMGLAESLLNGLARVPFQRPWEGPGSLLDNVGQSVTRQVIRSFMGYSTGLPIDEFRSMEKVLDKICRVVMPPFVELGDSVEITYDTVGGVNGAWCRARASSDTFIDDAEDRRPIESTILYLHGGGFIGTSPIMYSAFAAALVRITGAEVFIADYRMAPEFPFPAGVHDAADVYRDLLHRGVDSEHLVVAGDSSGGGMATSLMSYLHSHDLPMPAAVALFSPEVDLDLNQPSVTDNAPCDILPWNVPVAPYLQGIRPDDERIAVVHAAADLQWFPPTFVCWGADEMFRDAIRGFAENLQRGGVPVYPMEEPGMFHVFPILMPWAEPSKRVFRQLHDLSRRHVEPDPYAEQTH